MRRILTAILGVLIVAVGALDIMLVLPDITFGKGAGKTPGELSSPIVKLTTVSDFEAENEGTSKIKLNWMALRENTTDFVIYRKAESNGVFGKYKKIAVLGSEVREYTDEGLSQAIVYKYKLYAYYGKEAHSMSSAAEAMTDILPIKGFGVAHSDLNGVQLKWNENPGADMYSLYRSEEGGEYELIDKLSPYTSSYTDTGIDSGKIYKYRIYAYRESAGFSSLSPKRDAKTVIEPAPCLEVGLSGKKKHSIKLSYEKVPRADGYEIYRAKQGLKFKKLGETDKLKYKDETYKDSNEYVYKVRAYRKVDGEYYYGAFTEVGTKDYVEPVSSLSGNSYLGKILLKWKNPSDTDGVDIFLYDSDGYKEIKSTDLDYYLTKKRKIGKKYTFALKAYRKENGKKLYAMSKRVTVKNVDTAYGEKPGKTYVVVFTEGQRLTMYVDGKKYLTTPVVTGMYGHQDTDPGYHIVLTRGSPARLKGEADGHSWDVKVQYWMGFTNEGQGIHDATWRSSFGGTIYKGDGSNGCVNTPLEAVKKIYEKSFYNMPVIVY